MVSRTDCNILGNAFVSGRRTRQEDVQVILDVEGVKASNILFIRLVAKERCFTKVDFRYCIFETCYIRKCTFINCDFTGCRMSSSNFRGTRFIGCKFDYAIFDRTFIESDILSEGCPGPENLRQHFARSLRMNFQQIGNAEAVNKAIQIELEAEEDHLRKAWRSNESYYRSKYKSTERANMLLKWMRYVILDFVWGNGEKFLNLFRLFVILLLLTSGVDYIFGPSGPIVDSAIAAPQIFFGTRQPSYIPDYLITTMTILRLVVISLFMAMFVKRFSRR